MKKKKVTKNAIINHPYWYVPRRKRFHAVICKEKYGHPRNKRKIIRRRRKKKAQHTFSKCSTACFWNVSSSNGYLCAMFGIRSWKSRIGVEMSTFTAHSFTFLRSKYKKIKFLDVKSNFFCCFWPYARVTPKLLKPLPLPSNENERFIHQLEVQWF